MGEDKLSKVKPVKKSYSGESIRRMRNSKSSEQLCMAPNGITKIRNSEERKEGYNPKQMTKARNKKDSKNE